MLYPLEPQSKYLHLRGNKNLEQYFIILKTK